MKVTAIISDEIIEETMRLSEFLKLSTFCIPIRHPFTTADLNCIKTKFF